MFHHILAHVHNYPDDYFRSLFHMLYVHCHFLLCTIFRFICNQPFPFTFVLRIFYLHHVIASQPSKKFFPHFVTSFKMFLFSTFPSFYNTLLRYSFLCPFSSSNLKGNTTPLYLRTKFMFCNIFALYFLSLTCSSACSIKTLFDNLNISISES